MDRPAENLHRTEEVPQNLNKCGDKCGLMKDDKNRVIGGEHDIKRNLTDKSKQAYTNDELSDNDKRRQAIQHKD